MKWNVSPSGQGAGIFEGLGGGSSSAPWYLLKSGISLAWGAVPAGEQLRAEVINSQMLQEHRALPSNWENLGPARIVAAIFTLWHCRARRCYKKQLQKSPSLKHLEKHLWGAGKAPWALPYLGDSDISFSSSWKLPRPLNWGEGRAG